MRVFISVHPARRGAALARLTGEMRFGEDVRLVVRERLTFDRLPMTLHSYGHEVWRGQEKVYWYDSQPHPDDPALQATHPHHNHAPPCASGCERGWRFGSKRELGLLAPEKPCACLEEQRRLLEGRESERRGEV